MKYSKLVQTILLATFFNTIVAGQVGGRQPVGRLPVFPPDIVPPEVLQNRDALQADPQHYRLEFENDRMRVLRLTLRPNEEARMHDSIDALAVCLNECHIHLTYPNGRSEDVHLEAGVTRWIFGDRRSEKNLSTKPVELLFIETKNPKAK
jgi:hypothetical protein